MAKAKSEEFEIKEICYPITIESFYSSGDIVKRVENLLKSGKLNPTLLISGPSSVGKTTLAYIISAAIECERPNPFACGNCLSCRKIKKGLFPDLRYITLKEMDTGKMRTQIVIEQVRDDILKVAELPPYEGKKLIFIIEPAEALNSSCQNALLKILEEPPEYVQFILIAKEVSRLLPTVRSRCQEISLKELTFEETYNIAKKLKFVEDAKKAAEVSRGRMGLIISEGWKDYLTLSETLQKILLYGRNIEHFKEVNSKIDELVNGYKGKEAVVLDETLYIIKEIIRVKEGQKNQMNMNIKKEVLDKISKEDLYKKEKRTIEAAEMLNRNVGTKLIYNYIFLGE